MAVVRIMEGLKKFRFLAVVGLALAVLSSPFLTEAGSKNASPVSILAVEDTVAGLGSSIELQGKSYQNIEVSVEKPGGEILLLETVADAQGKATVTLSAYHLRRAGSYEVAARDLEKNGTYGPAIYFEVHASTVSETQSQVDFSKNSAQVGETVEMTVSLLDAYRNGIEGHVLKVIPSDVSVSVYSPEFSTNADGHMNFYVSSSKKGIVDFTIYDSSVNKTLVTQAKLAFSGSGSFTEIGGHDVILADTGPVASFVITGLSGSTVVGDDTTVTVTAVDKSGFTVSNYTGTIRFSSSDAEATLPGDYTFLAKDQGEHSFSLGVKFVTPDTQTLTVTDIDKTTLTGEAETEVVTTEESGVDYDSDFETTDFDREGDFTLISPASGSYSSDSLEVQGEAEYAYTAVIYLDEEEAGRVEVDFDNSFTYTLEDLEDGTYELYVDIVKLGDGDPGEEEILEVIESSDVESVTIDTTAPKLVSIKSDPDEDITTKGRVTITVLSEADLEEAAVLFQDEVFTMEETSTSGKYQVDLVMPDESGDYSLDVVLMDALGNEAQYRDQLSLSVGESTEDVEEDAKSDAEEDNGTVEGIEQVTGVTATGSEESVLLSWETPDSENNIAFYRVYYGPSQESLYALSETYDSSTSWRIMDLSGEALYYFAVSAVDVEGNEGTLSELVLGVPLLSSVSSTTDIIDDTSETPTISGSEDEVEEIPETGPAQTALLLLSALGAMAFTARKKLSLNLSAF